MDRGAWWATVHGVAKSWTSLSDLRTPQNVMLTSQSCNRRSLTHVTCLSKGLVHYGVLKSVNYSFLCILASLNIAAPKLLFKKSS